MNELLSLLTTVSWPGVIAVGIFAMSQCYRAWLTSRRASLRLGDLSIDAASTQDLLRILQERERLALPLVGKVSPPNSAI
jgi:hypothetical protein